MVTFLVAALLAVGAEAQQWKTDDTNGNMVNQNSGNVGIGTEMPNSKLHSGGTVTVGPLDGDAYRMYGSTDPNLRWALTNSAAGVFGIALRGDSWVSQATALLIDRAGNVGIGTAPAGKLANTSAVNDDGGTGGNVNTFNWASAAPGYTATLVNDAVEGNANGLLVKTADTQRTTLVFSALSGANLPRLAVAADGNVGIGTKNPSSRLQVEGNVALAENYSAAGAGAARFVGIPGVIPGSFTGAGAFIGFTQGGTNGASNDIRFFTHHSGVSAGERMRIDEAGKIGIGTATPRARLDVVGAGSSSVDVRVNGRIQTGDAANYGGVWLDGAGSMFVGQATTDTYGFYGPTGWQMLVHRATGNVGIGVPNPAHRLDVAGDANFSGTVSGGNIQAKYQDVAEWVTASGDLEPATVVIVNPERTDEVMQSHAPYDTRVAGVVSIQPGLVLGERGVAKEMIATTGRVRVKVDASSAPISAGDLLVTSGRAGTAMKSEPVDFNGRKFHQPGTIIGKALEPLKSGVGEILVLLSMQ